MSEVLKELQRKKEARNYTLDDLAKRLDFPMMTISRWLRTHKINKLYEQQLKERLKRL